MRNFKLLAALSAALMAGGAVSAKEKPAQPKPKKICRTEQLSGRITPQRVCRVVPPSDAPAAGDEGKAADSRPAAKGRD
jgi:hypothetical protein